jgi:ribosomal protein S18 acetylase RimI-like enzyme
MSPEDRRARAIQLLREDPLRHIVSLKMLTHRHGQVELCLVEAEHGWALLLSFPSDLFEYDAKAYGPGRRVIVLEGTTELAQRALLEQRPNTNVIIKTPDVAVARYALEALGAASVTAFVSFTVPERRIAPLSGGTEAAGAIEGSPQVFASTTLDDELRDIFARNGYAAAELERYFAAGAHAFGIRMNGAVAAACFVFQNFEAVWEIAGVHTAVQHRRQGLAARVVRAAEQHLLERGLCPRYQTEASNRASIELARHIGLVEFLRIEHLMVGPLTPLSRG